MLTLSNNEPLLTIWFGNFYKPAFDDEVFIEDTVNLIQTLGFNCVELDAKAWQDFEDRFNGGDASQYVKAQEYIMQSVKRHGLTHCFLALYLNADNLYPNIRFSPPIYGESVTDETGADGKWYKYWSDKARDSMEHHVRGLLQQYSGNHAQLHENNSTRIPLCSMWDPIVAPSFDEEGRQRYLLWLRGEYADIGRFNQAYQTNAASFDSLQKEDYWFSCAFPNQQIYSQQQHADNAPCFVMWCDNAKWRKDELCDYFKEMQQRFSAFNPKPYLSPNMAQWSYFLNIDGSKLSGVGMADLWDTAMRGIDIYRLAPYVDNCHFLTVPVTPMGDADAYVVACQHSMMRNMNDKRDFMGGIFWGRFLYNDIYETLTPCEIVGSIVASGAKGIWSYGINGLDDGGLLHKMDSGFLNSLKTANQWAKQVIPMVKGTPVTEIALLFPSAMSLFEPLIVPQSDMRRLDLLGWYKACCDLGHCPDVVDLSMIENDVLERFKVLIIPANSCYSVDIRPKAEQKLKNWVENGGILLHGPQDALVQSSLGISGWTHEKDCAISDEGILLQGDEYQSFVGEESLATYKSDHAGCIVRNKNIYSFGFRYGYSYTAKTAPHVPLHEKNNALYPVTMLKNNILNRILSRYFAEEVFEKGVEKVAYENGIFIVNHTSHPISTKQYAGKKFFQLPNVNDILPARSAVWVSNT